MRVVKRICDFCSHEDNTQPGERWFLYLWAASFAQTHDMLDACSPCADKLTVREVEQKIEAIHRANFFKEQEQENGEETEIYH